MSLLYNLDQYCATALNSSLVIYPFRFFAFISRYNFSVSVRGILNTIVRISPGLFTYFNIVAIIALCVSASSGLLLGPIVPEMSSLTGAIFMTLSTNLMDLPQLREYIASGANTWHPLIVFTFQKLMTFALVVCIALAVYLFAKAVACEETVAVESKMENQAPWVQEVYEKVC